MKERNELARAMNDLPDDLLLEAEQTARAGRVIKFRRFVAAAAVIALLAVTVGAVSLGFTWKVEPESGEELVEKYGEIAWDYYKDNGSTMNFEKLEYSIPLGRVELPEAGMMRLRNILYRHWNLTQLVDYQNAVELGEDQEFWFDASVTDFYLQDFANAYGVSQDVGPCFATLEDVEELLGMKLKVPEALREAIRSESEKYGSGLGLRIFTGQTYTEVRELKGNAEPIQIVVNWQLSGYCTNGTVNGFISIPLTEETAQNGIQGLHYSYEKEGAIWQEEQNIGKRTVTLFGNAPEAGYDGWAEAIYIQDGIGYAISADRDADIPYYSSNWPYYDSAKEIVLSLFADGE